ncbi:MAG: BrnA antitoxin family protein [Pseudomonadota bacterium]
MPRKKTRKTRAQMTALDRIQRDIIYLDREAWVSRKLDDLIPPEWHTLERDVDVDPKKQKVTLYLDAPVVRYFRGMGNGYQERINRLLSTWMNMKVADELKIMEVIEGRLKMDEYLEREVGEKPSTDPSE